MRYLRYAFLGALGVVLVSVSLANRDQVSLQLVPDGLVQPIGVQATVMLPLFVVVLISVAVGIMIGFAWEWLREHKHRREATVKTREVRRLRREVGSLKGERDKHKDEVLAILDDAS